MDLANFDPLVWWRGAEGSAWRRGPHRLSAELQAAVLWRREATTALAADTLSASRNFARALAHIWTLAGNDIAGLDTDALAASTAETHALVDAARLDHVTRPQPPRDTSGCRVGCVGCPVCSAGVRPLHLPRGER